MISLSELTVWFGSASVAAAWGFALYIYLVAPRTQGALYLIAILVVDGFALITSGLPFPNIKEFILSIGFPALPKASHQVSDWVLIALYLPFIGMTLKTPLVKPFKHPLGKKITLYGGIGFALTIFFLPEDVREVFNMPFYLVICIVLTYSFIAALHSWMIATNSAEKERARAFTIAFGIRDILWSFTFGSLIIYWIFIGDPKEAYYANTNGLFWALREVFYQVALLLYVPMVAYGILRLQLFDIDLRIKRTIKRSTVAAAFVATFFVVSELASNYLSDQLGNVMGVIATGILVFFFDTVQRAADKVSDAAMPNTNESDEYTTFRKLQVYESAISAAMEDGHISDRQRRVLNSMVASMGLDSNVARQIEKDTLASLTPTSS